MCGIAGWINWNKNLTRKRDILTDMQDSLIHRGPDESGSWIDENAGLVHRRLIVIDPEGGKQPMEKNKLNNKYIITYNGELYNTGKLRRELRGLGYDFKSRSDTEVVLTSYLAWGEECVRKLNGIFAFGIWDVKEEKLYLARDRLGVKPLFYTQKEESLLFGSEIKSLLTHPEVKPELAEEGLAEVLVMGPGRTPGQGVFKGISELKPAHYLVYDKSGIRKSKYWSLESKPHRDTLEETADHVKNLFVDTVDRQLISDVPICTLLSGGLDSSAITAVAGDSLRETCRGELNTYSVDYRGNEDYFEANEFQPDADDKWIKLMSDYANTFHHNVVLSNKELVRKLKEGVYARNLPGMADIDVSLYLFCREIKKDFTVAVSGECADEIFCGYPWYYREEALTAETFPWSRRIESRLRVLDSRLTNQIKPGEYLDQRYQEALEEVPHLPGEREKDRTMREMTYLTLTRWMPVLLERKDRMSMYNGLEVRVPFCDHRLVEYVWNIPWEMKNHGGMRKGILREALKGILPEEIRTRPKNPYPKTFNPVYFELTKEWLRDILEDPNAPLHQVIDTEEVKKLTQQDKEFDIPWFGQLMRLPQLFAYLIQINIWLDEYNVEIKL